MSQVAEESTAIPLSIKITGANRQTYDVKLAIQTETGQVTVTDIANVDVDPSANADALVLRNENIEALPDDRDDLATDLQALAGPAPGPNGGQIYIDGFTGGRLPSKQSIREIRINQNPFAAQYDRPGEGAHRDSPSLARTICTESSNSNSATIYSTRATHLSRRSRPISAANGKVRLRGH